MLRRLLLVLASLVVSLALVEGVTRMWLKFQGRGYTRAATEQAIGEVLNAVGGLTAGVDAELDERGQRKGPKYQLQPYTGYVPYRTASLTTEMVKHFRSGKGDAYEILVQGGSVAAGFQGRGLDALTQYLEESGETAGRPVEVFGLSVPGYKQPQQFTQLAYLLSQGCHPDLVINLNGLNELRIGSGNLGAGFEPSFPSRGHWGSLLSKQGTEQEEFEDLLRVHQAQTNVLDLGQEILDRGDCASAFMGILALSRIAGARAEWAAAQEALTARRTDNLSRKGALGYGVPKKGRDGVRESVACWKRSSLAMHQLCEARGIRYVHVLQPTMHDKGSKVLTEDERRVGIGDARLHPAVVRGYPLLRRALAELRELGVEAIDACNTFEDVEQTVYVDSCHFTQEGNAILGFNIAKEMGLTSSEGSAAGAFPVVESEVAAQAEPQALAEIDSVIADDE